MDSIITMYTTSLYNFDRVTDTVVLKIISSINRTTCSSDPFPTSTCNYTNSTTYCKSMFDHGGF